MFKNILSGKQLTSKSNNISLNHIISIISTASKMADAGTRHLAPTTNFNAMRYILLYLDLHIEVRIVGF